MFARMGILLAQGCTAGLSDSPEASDWYAYCCMADVPLCNRQLSLPAYIHVYAGVHAQHRTCHASIQGPSFTSCVNADAAASMALCTQSITGVGHGSRADIYILNRKVIAEQACLQQHAALQAGKSYAGHMRLSARRRRHLEDVQRRAARGATRMLGQQEGRHGAAIERREELARRQPGDLPGAGTGSSGCAATRGASSLAARCWRLPGGACPAGD